MDKKNYIHKDKIRDKLNILIDELEKADMGGFADEVRDMRANLLMEE